MWSCGSWRRGSGSTAERSSRTGRSRSCRWGSSRGSCPCGSRRRPATGCGRPAAARFDARHLDERLGLFTLIVIGESGALTVEASSEAEWTSRLGSMAAGSFVLLLALWALAVRRSCGVPLLGFGVLPPPFALPLHCVSTGALGALAASLGGAMVVVPILLGAFAGRGSPAVAGVGPRGGGPLALAVREAGHASYRARHCSGVNSARVLQGARPGDGTGMRVAVRSAAPRCGCSRSAMRLVSMSAPRAEEAFRVRRGGGSARSPMEQLQRL